MTDIGALADRALGLAGERGRALVGIAGAPGAGKTTLATALVDLLRRRGASAATVPMDGFHLADAALDALGLRQRKGVPETFDGDGYAALLERVRAARATVWAPAFERVLEQPIAGSIPVPADTRVVVTEGNYLLVPRDPWLRAAAVLDEVWYVEQDAARRRRRLLARHLEFGKSPEAAAEWMRAVDDPDAGLVESTRSRAALIVSAD